MEFITFIGLLHLFHKAGQPQYRPSIEFNPLVEKLLVIPGGLLLAKALSVLMVAGICWFINKEIPERREDLLQIMMLIIGGMAIVVTMNALNILAYTGRL